MGDYIIRSGQKKGRDIKNDKTTERRKNREKEKRRIKEPKGKQQRVQSDEAEKRKRKRRGIEGDDEFGSEDLGVGA